MVNQPVSNRRRTICTRARAHRRGGLERRRLSACTSVRARGRSCSLSESVLQAASRLACSWPSVAAPMKVVAIG
eukprot:4421775-Pleurochrysis_carterae.AAC.1